MITLDTTKDEIKKVKNYDICNVVWTDDEYADQHWIDIAYREKYEDGSFNPVKTNIRIQGQELIDWITTNFDLKEMNKAKASEYLITELGLTGTTVE